MLYDNLNVNEKGHLSFAGYDTAELAEKYGTPLYLMDEDRIRSRVREYKSAFERYFPAGSVPEFASKAFCCKQIYRIMAEEGIDIDVVSPGEIYTAKTAGFPMEKSFFHGNNKTDGDIRLAIDSGVGYFVADNTDELEALEQIAGEKGVKQRILLRVTPGIDPHTHKKISTGSVESKFGISIETGQAFEAVKSVLAKKNIILCGFHCHIGSQIFESSPFGTALEIMLEFIKRVKDELGFAPDMLNLGGGFGVRYTENDPEIDYTARIREVSEIINLRCEQMGLIVPKILMEPGRSIVADSGITLYTVGGVKEITGYKNYVSIDGGMTDNPRYALYQSEYSVVVANKANEPAVKKVTIAGRCCESGDLIQENTMIQDVEVGDTLAVLSTGAYNYSMASNYNRIGKPAVVMVRNGEPRVVVKRETYADLVRNDI